MEGTTEERGSGLERARITINKSHHVDARDVVRHIRDATACFALEDYEDALSSK